jgi:hypothetical protein
LNYYLNISGPSHLIYFGSGLYHASKKIYYRYGGETLEGETPGTSVTGLLGYMFQNNNINLNAGFGSLYFLKGRSEVVVSNGSLSTLISSRADQLLIEASIGMRF